MSAKKILINKIAQDDLTNVISNLFLLAEQYEDNNLLNDSTIQSSRLKALEKQRINNTISEKDDELKTAKIRHSLILIINNLPSNWQLVEENKVNISSTIKTTRRKLTTYSTVICLIFGVILIYYFTNYDKPLESKDSTSNKEAISTGNYSPALVNENGNIEINYGDAFLEKDSSLFNQKTKE